MSTVLLLGAGFSRNWGGWLASEAFEYLLGCPEVLADPELRDLLWRAQPNGGFEAALAEVQQAFIRDHQANTGRLLALQAAVARMFEDMNRGYGEQRFEFQQHQAALLRTMLVKFDAIFTLNQDLLLEQHYLNENISLSDRRWDGWVIPGTRLDGLGRVPLAPENFTLHDRLQPYFKLHGSCDWRDPVRGSLMIMGGRKAQEIQFHQLLVWYFEQLERYLAAPNSKLVVIGYSFRDDHVNAYIQRAVEEFGLKLFVVDPTGSDIARNLRHLPRGAVGEQPHAMEAVLQRSLQGASRRSLREIFGGDEAERGKLYRFLDA